MSYNFQNTNFHNSLSKYEIIKPLGRGAGSFVYKIKDRKTGQSAALKVIDKHNSKFAKTKSRLLNEIDVHSKINHENIVKFFTHFEDEDNYYIMIELCEGGELYSKTKAKGKLSEDEIRFYGFQFAQGLKYLHDNKILHRDLKLSNLLITDKDVLKICDFGLSVKLSDLQPERETLCGTPNYLAPELVNEEPYGIKADCWAFGCILYAMATGSPPFEGSNLKDTLANIKKGTLKVPDYMSRELQDLLKNLINYDSSIRFNIDNAITHPFFLPCLRRNPVPVASELDNYYNKVQNLSQQQSNRIKQKNFECLQHEKSDNVADKKRPSNHTKCFSTIISPQIKMRQAAHPSSTNSKESKHVSPSPVQPQKNKENSGDLKNYLNFHDTLEIRMHSEPEYNSRNEVYPFLTQALNVNANTTPLFSKDKFQGRKVPEISPSIVKQLDIQLKDLPNNMVFAKKSSPKGGEKLSRHLDRTLSMSINLNTTSRTNTSPAQGTERFLSFVTEEDDFQFTERKLDPLNTFAIEPNKFNAQNRIIEIDENGFINIEIPKMQRRLSISPNGLKISVRKYHPTFEENTYDLVRLPYKYHRFYEYATKVCELIKSKVPKVIVEDQDGTFCLLKTNSKAYFEAKFKKGVQVQHVLSTETVRVDMNDGSVYEINILGDMSYLGSFICSIVEKTIEKMRLCLQKKNELH